MIKNIVRIVLLGGVLLTFLFAGRGQNAVAVAAQIDHYNQTTETCRVYVTWVDDDGNLHNEQVWGSKEVCYSGIQLKCNTTACDANMVTN